MSEDEKGDRESSKAKCRLGRYWFGVFVLAPVVIVGGLAWRAMLLSFRSVDGQLAAIEAARAIPESENAGAEYIKLAGEYLPLPQYPRVVDNKALVLTTKEPWLSGDYPKLAAWIDERQDLISKLLDISKMEECLLPIPLDNRQTSSFNNPMRHLHGWTYLLIRSANMDITEGRIDAAIEKYASILKIGTHLRQQPTLSTYYSGSVTHYPALDLVRRLVTRKALTEEQLTAIEAAVLPDEDNWEAHLKLTLRVQALLERQKRPRITDWRRYWDYRRRTSRAHAEALERVGKSRLNVLADKREICILIALRRYRSKTGYWPQSLDLIEPQLSKKTLTDPRSNKPFVYEVTGENFRLGSKELD